MLLRFHFYCLPCTLLLLEVPVGSDAIVGLVPEDILCTVAFRINDTPLLFMDINM